MAKRLTNPLSTPPTWQERIAAALMDAEYGTDRNAWRPDPHIDMVRLDPSYFLVAKHLAAAAALIASGVVGDEPTNHTDRHGLSEDGPTESASGLECATDAPTRLLESGAGSIGRAQADRLDAARELRDIGRDLEANEPTDRQVGL